MDRLNKLNKKDYMTRENGSGHSVRDSYSTFAVKVHTASRVAHLGTGYLIALRHEMLSVTHRIDDELKRRKHARH